MRLIVHPKAVSDVDQIMAHYEQAATIELADEFSAELRHRIMEVAQHPESFTLRGCDLRRVNLARFPYHFLFRVIGDAVQVMVVRHHRRNPSWGMRRR